MNKKQIERMEERFKYSDNRFGYSLQDIKGAYLLGVSDEQERISSVVGTLALSRFDCEVNIEFEAPKKETK